jgi:hypothetical protein
MASGAYSARLEAMKRITPAAAILPVGLRYEGDDHADY